MTFIHKKHHNTGNEEREMMSENDNKSTIQDAITNNNHKINSLLAINSINNNKRIRQKRFEESQSDETIEIKPILSILNNFDTQI